MGLHETVIWNDVQGIKPDTRKLNIGDLVGICYRHGGTKAPYVMGDYAYFIGYIVRVQSDHISLSNRDPTCLSRKKIPERERAVTYAIDRIAEMTRYERR